MASLLSKKISFYRASEVADGQGGYDSNGVLVASRFAEVKEQTQIQREQAGQVGNDKTYNIKLDSRGLTIYLTDIIIYNGNRLDILTISSINERGLEYLIVAVERKKV
jgi:SPP1 family predicted phage head-tail adaptor